MILAAAMHALEGNSCPGHVKKTSYQVADETNDNKASTNDDNLLRRYNFPALHISRIEVSTGGGLRRGQTTRNLIRAVGDGLGHGRWSMAMDRVTDCKSQTDCTQ